MPARKIPMVPDIVTSDELAKNGYDLGVAAYRIPLGIDYANMQLFHIDLLKKSVLAIVGGEKSGKTNIVKHIINCIQRQIFDNYTEVYIADDSGKLETLCEYGCVKQLSLIHIFFGTHEKTKRQFCKFLGLCMSDIRDLKIAAFLYGPSTVPYTHLDVYKRQVLIVATRLPAL